MVNNFCPGTRPKNFLHTMHSCLDVICSALKSNECDEKTPKITLEIKMPKNKNCYTYNFVAGLCVVKIPFQLSDLFSTLQVLMSGDDLNQQNYHIKAKSTGILHKNLYKKQSMAVATEHPQNYFVQHHKTNGLLLDTMSTKTTQEPKHRSKPEDQCLRLLYATTFHTVAKYMQVKFQLIQ